MNEKLLNERIQVLHTIVKRTFKDYFDTDTNQGQKGLYETVIGATIWYLPGGDELFSGQISIEALNSIKSNPEETKLVEEHSFPRKIGGRFIYEKFKESNGQLSLYALKDLFLNRLGKFNLVLKSENDRLKKYQKIENMDLGNLSFLEFCQTNLEADTYSQADIQLTGFTVEKYKEFKRFKNKANKGIINEPFNL